ncbi:hypothetical protein D3C79_1116170 [compost metagenome]
MVLANNIYLAQAFSPNKKVTVVPVNSSTQDRSTDMELLRATAEIIKANVTIIRRLTDLSPYVCRV